MKILYIDSCIRKNSRTRQLAEHLITKLKGEVTVIKLSDINITALDEKALEERETGQGESLNLAKQFAVADIIVISAPYWDLGFPALLKNYIERITVSGITFEYESGIPKGLCKAQALYYVTTCGGSYCSSFGYDYIKTLAQSFYSVKNTVCFYADELDVWGNDVTAILEDAKKRIDVFFNA